ncbi:F-box protein At5g18160-like [Bidens hawaiensis]|uniref:F-box protein At5g18160-like n=1 Tax=Bidens hawaiensis TaxID=980011 RepID=UPI004049C3BF
MSDYYYVPFEIQSEILKFRPVKSLIRFRSVSKTWKSLIDGSEFITRHSSNSSSKHQLILSCEYSVDFKKQTHVLIADDDDATFPHHRVFLTVPVLVNRLRAPMLLNSSHGLFCFYGMYTNTMAVVCNLSIRKAVAVLVPFERADGKEYRNIVGFGVCPQTIDPKIINIARTRLPINGTIPWQVQVSVNGFLYWLAADNDNAYNIPKPVIVSLDMTTEQFGELNLPHTLAHRCIRNIIISKSRESLIVIERNKQEASNNLAFVIWMMKDGISKSLTKLYTFNVGAPYASLKGFRENGEPIIELYHESQTYQLVVYNPHSKCVHTLRSAETKCAFSMHPYMEHYSFLITRILWFIMKLKSSSFKIMHMGWVCLQSPLISRTQFSY